MAWWIVSGWPRMWSIKWATSARGTDKPPRRFWPDHGPVQAALAKDVLHLGEIGEDLAEPYVCHMTEHVPHEEAVTRVVFGRAGPASRGQGADRRRADGYDAPHAGGAHGRDDRGHARRHDARVGVRVRAKA